MKIKHISISAILFIITAVSYAPIVFAQYQAEFTPSISIGELYDDNIDLDRDNKKVDWITTVSPGIMLNIQAEGSNNLMFRYSPSMVRYKNETQNNTVRHSGSLIVNKSLSSRFSFNLADTLIRSEEPVEETEGIYGIRQSRRSYLRNNSTAGIEYIFGPENSLKLGYNYSLLRNDDSALTDNDAYYPSADLTFWMGVNNGFELVYQGSLIDYSRNGEQIDRESISGDTGGIKYIYRFSTRTKSFIGYTFNSRYTGEVKDYNIHDGKIGLEHAFSDDVSLNVSGGYFLLKDDVNGDDNGYSYEISLNRNFSRGAFSLTGSGGWREDFLEAEQRGFSKYHQLESGFNYQFRESLNNHAGLSFMLEKNALDLMTRNYRANYGWTLSFMRWFSISLDYSYIKRDDDLDERDYNINRVMMTLTASRLFR
jgi:hypothetical protein